MLHRRSWFFSILAVATLSGCLFRGADAPSVAASFYQAQRDGTVFPAELFVDDAAMRASVVALAEREARLGDYLSYKRVGSNRQITLDGAGRRETVTLIFEVQSENGRTRETLVITRSSSGESFRIASFQSVDAGVSPDAAPSGTHSA